MCIVNRPCPAWLHLVPLSTVCGHSTTLHWSEIMAISSTLTIKGHDCPATKSYQLFFLRGCNTWIPIVCILKFSTYDKYFWAALWTTNCGHANKTMFYLKAGWELVHLTSHQRVCGKSRKVEAFSRNLFFTRSFNISCIKR